MPRVNAFAEKHPATFGLTVTVLFILMVILSAILGNLWPGAETYGSPGSILGKLLSIVALLILLFRLGWLRSA